MIHSTRCGFMGFLNNKGGILLSFCLTPVFNPNQPLNSDRGNEFSLYLCQHLRPTKCSHMGLSLLQVVDSGFSIYYVSQQHLNLEAS